MRAGAWFPGSHPASVSVALAPPAAPFPPVQQEAGGGLWEVWQPGGASVPQTAAPGARAPGSDPRAQFGRQTSRRQASHDRETGDALRPPSPPRGRPLTGPGPAVLVTVRGPQNLRRDWEGGLSRPASAPPHIQRGAGGALPTSDGRVSQRSPPGPGLAGRAEENHFNRGLLCLQPLGML